MKFPELIFDTLCSQGFRDALSQVGLLTYGRTELIAECLRCRF